MRTAVAPLLALTLCLTVHPARAARTLSADHAIAVKLEPSQPTAIVLPEPVASVSVGVAPERFSLDYDGPYLFLLPLDPTVAGRLFVVGQSGTLYTLTFQVAAPADDVVHVTAAAAQPHAGGKPQPFSVASLLRALRAGSTVPGQQPVDLPPPALPDTRVQVTGSSAYTIGSTLGLVLTLKNTQMTPLPLDLRMGDPGPVPGTDVVHLSTWTWPPRLTIKAIAADAEVLVPEAETRLYVVLER